MATDNPNQKVRELIIAIRDAEKEGSVTNVMVAQVLEELANYLSGKRELLQQVVDDPELAASSQAVKKFIESLMEESLSDSTNKIPTSAAVKKALANFKSGPEVEQEVSESTTKVPSSKAVSEAIKGSLNSAIDEIPYLYLNWDTDAATTRALVPSNKRKKNLCLGYLDPVNGFIIERYIDDVEINLSRWKNSAYWQRIFDISSLVNNVSNLNSSVSYIENSVSIPITESNIHLYANGAIVNRAVLQIPIPINMISSITLEFNKSLLSVAINGYTSYTIPTKTGGTYDSGWLSQSNYTFYPSDIEDKDVKYIIFCFGGSGYDGAGLTVDYIKNHVKILLNYNLYEHYKIFEDKPKQIVFTRNPSVKIGMHRGYHRDNVPENSLDAYRLAGDYGADYVETDINATLDGEIVLLHDQTLNRTFRTKDGYETLSNTVNVREHNLEDLRNNYVLASEDVRMRRPIPTLDEFLKTCYESGVFPIMDIGSSMSKDNIKKAFEKGCEILGEGNFGFCGAAMDLDYVRTLSKITILWYLLDAGIADTVSTINGESRNNPYNYWYPEARSTMKWEGIREHHSKGIKVAVWNVTTSNHSAYIMGGVDVIVSDYINPNIPKGTLCSLKSIEDVTTTGTVNDDKSIYLASGQTIKINTDLLLNGAYYFSFIGKGQYSVSLPSGAFTCEDKDFTRHRSQGYLKGAGTLTIKATADTVIQFFEFVYTDLYSQI